ncbi:MAG TPA: hypothetical protein VK540_26585 [Polyangiaceae bacterium]|nr:hypothetical protein [Polyangiaceae bacterium]
MKPTRADFSADQPSAAWRPLAITIAVAIMAALLVVAAVTMSGCDQKPIPINPSPGWPCGTGYYFECPDHGCCARGERCGEKGHACHEGECCWDGDMFGASRDGGRGAHPELTPDEARKAAPR